MSQVLENTEPIAQLAHAYKEPSSCITIGRGFNYATAYEVALKIKELTYIPAEPYSSADFQHGPVAMVHGGFFTIAIAPRGKTADEMFLFLEGLRSLGARLLVISNRSDILSLGESAIPLPAGIPEWLSPIVAVVPGQLFAAHMAKVRGIDPDRPRGLKKVTRTL